jgi:hypothetical protein
MAYLDVQNIFSDAQLVPAVAGPAAAVVSTNVVDQIGARVIGSGTPIDLLIQYSGVVGAASTLRAVLYGADDAAFTINKVVLADTGVSPVLPAGSSGLLRAAVKVTRPKRFLRIEYDAAGAAVQFGAVTAGFTPQEQTTPETLP